MTGKCFAFVEICEGVSLLSCLRNGRSTLQMPNSTISEEYLNQWSYHVVSGMEFLSSKRVVHVVHAGLARRNVLVTFDRTAKISDSGLSRRLHNYSQYVKKKKEPPPWRWIAPEALQFMEFTEMTDVWAFGVTLWEIFTYGKTPYPGLSWDINFVSGLIEGLRLEQPEDYSCN